MSVASSADDGNVAANTIDNDLSTRWSASGSGQWIQYDLGSTFSISQAVIAFFVGDTRSPNLRSSSLTMHIPGIVFSRPEQWNNSEQESYPIPNATGRFVRIVGYGNFQYLGTVLPKSISSALRVVHYRYHSTGVGRQEVNTKNARIAIARTARNKRDLQQVTWEVPPEPVGRLLVRTTGLFKASILQELMPPSL